VNRTEGIYIGLILEKLANSGVGGSDIGIITPYAGQQTYLVESLPHLCRVDDPDFYEDLEIASVDTFQGREKNFIIFSLVRANDQNQIGFLKDARRMCVSLTRAKYGLIVLGNADTFARNRLWVKFIEKCVSNGVFVQGEDLDSLTPSTFTSLVEEDEGIGVDEIDFMDLDTDDDQVF
jgi:regulator of nonsense transcripts 1